MHPEPEHGVSTPQDVDELALPNIDAVQRPAVEGARARHATRRVRLDRRRRRRLLHGLRRRTLAEEVAMELAPLVVREALVVDAAPEAVHDKLLLELCYFITWWSNAVRRAPYFAPAISYPSRRPVRADAGNARRLPSSGLFWPGRLAG